MEKLNNIEMYKTSDFTGLIAESLNAELELGVIDIKLPKDIKEDLKTVAYDKQMVRFITDQYRQAQQYRITQQNQCRSLLQRSDDAELGHFSFIDNMAFRSIKQEKLYEKYLDVITKEVPVCRWMRSITGIGPVFAGMLYSRFDPTKAKYATEFLSYAGLNDNNNPWLGTEKAKALTKDAIDYREELFNDKIISIILEYCNEEQYNHLLSDIKKMNDIEDMNELLAKIKENVKVDLSDKLDLSLIMDWAKWVKTPKICDDILINFCAEKTGRKIETIRIGVIHTNNSKKAKTSYITTEDLAAYLAKPPYNTELKRYMYLIGDCFVKSSGREKSLYGKIYKQKKLEYLMKNDKGEYAEQAKAILESKNFTNDTITKKALLEGKLTTGHLDMRARRYAVKLFISHVFEAMYYAEYHTEPPKTYVLEYMGHHDYIAPETDYRLFIDGEL